MWHLGTWFKDGHASVKLMTGVIDLRSFGTQMILWFCGYCFRASSISFVLPSLPRVVLPFEILTFSKTNQPKKQAQQTLQTTVLFPLNTFSVLAFYPSDLPNHGHFRAGTVFCFVQEAFVLYQSTIQCPSLDCKDQQL